MPFSPFFFFLPSSLVYARDGFYFWVLQHWTYKNKSCINQHLMEWTWLFLTPSWSEKPVAFTWRSEPPSAIISGVFEIFKCLGATLWPQSNCFHENTGQTNYRKAQRRPDEQVPAISFYAGGEEGGKDRSKHCPQGDGAREERSFTEITECHHNPITHPRELGCAWTAPQAN